MIYDDYLSDTKAFTENRQPTKEHTHIKKRQQQQQPTATTPTTSSKGNNTALYMHTFTYVKPN